MKSKLLLSAVAVALSLCLFSCEKKTDLPKDEGVKPGDKITVELTVKAAPYYVSGTETNDTRSSLANVWILEFDAEGKNVLASKINTVELDKAFSQEVIAGTDMKLVVVANSGSASFTEGGITYTQFSEMSYEGTMATSADIPLVGSGTAKIEEKDQKIAAISVSRIASVVSFKFAADGDHEMSTFQLKNVPAKVYYVSQGENSAWTSDKFTDLTPVAADGNEHTYIVGENLQGSDSGITDAKDKVTEKLAMYVEVLASKEGTEATTASAFKYFFGENATTSFDVARNKEYTADVTIDFDDESDKRVSQTITPATQNAGAANSYILAPDKVAYLGIPVSRVNEFWNTAEGGNTKANVISDGENGGAVTAWKASVIWTDTEESIIDIVTDNGTSADDYIAIAAKGKEGNAIIGIFDATAGEPAADAKPLWSWHIWVTDYNPGGGLNGDIPNITANPGQEEVDGGKVFRIQSLPNTDNTSEKNPAMMDRNLGALSADPNDGVKAIGAYYQWGRKEPFIFPQTTTAPKDYEFDKMTGAVTKQQAVQNPTKFISVSVTDWLDTRDQYLWSGTGFEKKKTIYDPCPEGWRVPNTTSFFDKEKGEDNHSRLAATDGRIFVSTVIFANKGLSINLPLVAEVSSNTGKISSSYNSYISIWAAPEHDASKGKYTRIQDPAAVDYYEYDAIWTNQSLTKANGANVRCVRE